MQGICSMGNTNKIWFMSFRSLESSEVMDQCTYCNQLSRDHCYLEVYSIIQQVLAGTVQTLKKNTSLWGWGRQSYKGLWKCVCGWALKMRLKLLTRNRIEAGVTKVMGARGGRQEKHIGCAWEVVSNLVEGKVKNVSLVKEEVVRDMPEKITCDWIQGSQVEKLGLHSIEIKCLRQRNDILHLLNETTGLSVE